MLDAPQTTPLAVKPTFTMPARFLVVASIFVAITIVKIVVFVVLALAGVVEPSVGTNAEKHYIPIAERLLAEGRFNGKAIAPHSYLLTTTCFNSPP
jgi:hypothetical protein